MTHQIALSDSVYDRLDKQRELSGLTFNEIILMGQEYDHVVVSFYRTSDVMEALVRIHAASTGKSPDKTLIAIAGAKREFMAMLEGAK